MNATGIGASVRRKEDQRFITGDRPLPAQKTIMSMAAQ
jgi:hypothetical protein